MRNAVLAVALAVATVAAFAVAQNTTLLPPTVTATSRIETSASTAQASTTAVATTTALPTTRPPDSVVFEAFFNASSAPNSTVLVARVRALLTAKGVPNVDGIIIEPFVSGAAGNATDAPVAIIRISFRLRVANATSAADFAALSDAVNTLRTLPPAEVATSLGANSFTVVAATTPAPVTRAPDSEDKAGTIAGAVVGAVVGAFLIGAVVMYCRRRARESSSGYVSVEGSQLAHSAVRV
jgi:hypothetical protein